MVNTPQWVKGMYINDVRRFLLFFGPPSPPNPILSDFCTFLYFMMSDFDSQTPPIYYLLYVYGFIGAPQNSEYFWQKNTICKSVRSKDIKVIKVSK